MRRERVAGQRFHRDLAHSQIKMIPADQAARATRDARSSQSGGAPVSGALSGRQAMMFIGLHTRAGLLRSDPCKFLFEARISRVGLPVMSFAIAERRHPLFPGLILDPGRDIFR